MISLIALHLKSQNTQETLKINCLLEIACFNVESAILAQRAGADRIELCDDYASGGITPSFETIKEARELISIPLFVMIRPRGGNFVYSGSEFEEMKQAVIFCRQNKIEGIVFGILTDHNLVDRKRCAELTELAKPMQVTFHRAFDEVSNPFQSMEEIIACGFNRILTSGQKISAPEGASFISLLIEKVNGRIVIMPGGGVRAENISELKNKTGAKEFHSSAINAKTMLADETEIREIKNLLSL
jgi:copper homeostasis protein